MIFRQLFDGESSTYTYLIGCTKTKEAVIIDPVLSQMDRDTKLIGELELNLKFAVDTHVHADHVSALGKLRERLGCRTGLARRAGVDCADLAFTDGSEILVGTHRLQVLETPGHTAGCLTYVWHDAPAWRLFTGDALLVRGCGRTDFQSGSAETLYDSIHRKIFSFPDEAFVYPGHDYRGHTVSTVGEERRLNPRLTLSRADFVSHMRDLNLPDPKMMAAAVPLNLSCGKVAGTAVLG